MTHKPTTHGRIVPAVFLVATLATLIACSAPSGAPTSAGPSAAPPSAAPASAAPPSAAPAADASAISIKGFEFSPASLTVKTGTTVTWTNDEDSLHTATAGTPDAPSGLFDSGEIDTGVRFPFTFDEAGTYPFFCARHEFMRGEVVVTP